MSFRSIQQNTVEKTDTFSISPQQSATINQYPNGQWFRNPTWPALPSITSSQERVVGIYAVYPDTPVIALYAVVTSGATYTVDWGDGNVNTYNSGTQANYTYDFNDADLANTNGPVTFTDSGDIVNRNNHGYQNDMPISFDSITTTTGIIAGQIYYVVNATTDTFQLAATPGGTPLTLTNDGSGIILPYKIAIVQIYPTSGAAFFQSTLTLNARHSSQSVSYGNGWLDLALYGRFSTLNLGATSPTVTGLLEQVRILKHRCTGLNFAFEACYKLQNVVEITADTGISVTLFNSMFTNCRSLKTIPLINTANATNMNSMFSGCARLQSIPLLNTANVTDMNSMFSGCNSLQTIPLLNTANVTNMSSMFSACSFLQTIPLLDTSKVANAQNMFNTCSFLQSIPLLNTANVTNMNSMFSGCASLQTIPLLDTIKVTDMGSMFNNCSSLQTIPLLNTANVTSIGSMFNNCSSLQTIPLLDTSNVTNMAQTFQSCSSLIAIPLLNTANVITMQRTFNTTLSLTTIPPLNTINVQRVDQMFQSCPLLQQIPALNLSNVSQSGNLTTFVSGSTSLSKVSVTNVYYSWAITSSKLSGTALNEIYTNLPNVWPANTVFNFTSGGPTNTISLANSAPHGYANLRTISFSSLTNITGVSTNTNYFVRNATSTTFQISTTTTGAIIQWVGTAPTGNVNGQTITVSGNWGTATDDPTIATAKGWTVTGS